MFLAIQTNSAITRIEICIDTYSETVNNDITPFKAILNDMYAKDISKKIRSVFKEKQKQGEYLCSTPAYRI